MKHFTFTGTSTIQRKFSIEIPATTYEEAQEKALNLLDDVNDSEYYTTGEDKVEVDIDSYDVTNERQRLYPIPEYRMGA